MKIARDSSASVWLEMIRGTAALAVLIFHVRYRFFLDYADLPESGLTAKLFYGATAFGHDAVIVFFVERILYLTERDSKFSGRRDWLEVVFTESSHPLVCRTTPCVVDHLVV